VPPQYGGNGLFVLKNYIQKNVFEMSMSLSKNSIRFLGEINRSAKLFLWNNILVKRLFKISGTDSEKRLLILVNHKQKSSFFYTIVMMAKSP